VAFRLPNLLRRLFAEGAFSQAFVPILGEVSSKDDPAQSKTLINAVATLLFWALLLTVGLGIVGAPLLILAIATGFSGSPAYEASVVMTQIMFPYIGLISMVSLSAGILNTFQRFAIPAFTPVLLNLALIGSALWLAPQLDQPIYALAFGVLIGGVLQLAIQIPALRKLGLLPRIGFLPQAIRSAWIKANGASCICRLRCANLLSHQYEYCLSLTNRQRLLAVLRRPPDGISDCVTGCGPRNCPATKPQSRQCPARHKTSQRAFGLGLAAHLLAGSALRNRATPVW
jgi:hypothetical protein